MAKENNAKKFGMRYPSIDKLLTVEDNKGKHVSKYKLVIASSKRAKKIVDGEEPLTNVECFLEVGQALEEIYEGKVRVIEKSSK